MTPEQATFLLNEVYLPQIHDEHKTTRRIIAAVPADQGAYKPSERCMSAWELASHIVVSHIFFLDGMSSGQFTPPAPLPDSIKTPADLLAWDEANFSKALDRVKAMSPADLVKPVSFFGVFNHPAVSYAGFMCSHAVHHRGQLSAYLRPMGAKVPRIYGGSADEPFQPPAQAQA